MEWEDNIYKMSYNILDKIENAYPGFTLGKNKQHELFINGVKTDIIVNEDFNDYESLKDELLKRKLIKIIKKDEE